MLGDIQTAFRTSLLDRTAALPAGVRSHSSERPERRYAVYRNTVLVSLIEALQSRFPATLRIVGDDCFREMARRYAQQSPPRSPVLLRFGDDFPAFVERFAAELGLPYLSDVMRLEVAWSQSYHAADAAPASVEALASLVPETLGDIRIALHPAARLVRSAYPVVTLRDMNVGNGELRPIDAWCGEDALVARPRFDVRVHRLPPGEFEFIGALFEGRTLAEATDAAFAAAEHFELAPALAGLVATGSALRFHQ